MYAEEYLAEDAVEEKYYNTENISVDESFSMDSQTKEQLKLGELYRRTNKHYYSYKVQTPEGIQRIRVYSNPLLNNSHIRNSSTGILMPHRVGSKYDDMYFSVMDNATHTKTDLYNEPRKLYYTNPEECERHLKIVVPTEIKQKWSERRLKY